jgi:peptide/nickel transport system permease protein
MRPRLALALLALLILASATLLVRSHFAYAAEDRDAILAPASALHTSGTDALGRDRTLRTATALLLGLAGSVTAATLSTALAALVGCTAAFLPGPLASILLLLVDVFLSLPWLFLLMMVRAGLPLTTSPLHSASITFLLLAALGWPACAWAVYRGARDLRSSDAMLHGRASGLRTPRLIRLHILPNLRTLLLPQFLLSIPAFLVAEANLGALGLGIAEPLPSWGSMLLELDHSALLASTRWVYLPLVVLVAVLFLLDALTAQSHPTEA